MSGKTKGDPSVFNSETVELSSQGIVGAETFCRCANWEDIHREEKQLQLLNSLQNLFCLRKSLCDRFLKARSGEGHLFALPVHTFFPMYFHLSAFRARCLKLMDLWSGRVGVVVCPSLTSQPRLRFSLKRGRSALAVLDQFRVREKLLFKHLLLFALLLKPWECYQTMQKHWAFGKKICRAVSL